MMTDLWTSLREESRPILLYGMGNGADKILDLCAARGIVIRGVFASDEFVRGQAFRGFTVMTYAKAKETFGDMVVLLSFATSRPEVMANIDRIAAEQTLLVPDVPVYGDEIFDLSFASAHKAELEAVRALLCDQESLRIFDSVVMAKLSGDYALLRSAYSADPDGLEALLAPETIRIAADLGAYTGDTALRLIPHAPHLERLICFEPDPKTFQRLQANLSSYPFVQPLPYAAWDKEELLSFRIGASRSSRLGKEGKTAEVQAMPLDAILLGHGCDYIKYDVEGADLPALLGSAQTIAVHRPRLLLSLYHRSGDLFTLPLALNHIAPRYRFYLRRALSLPAWDLNLIAIPT